MPVASPIVDRITVAVPSAPPPRLERALTLATGELERRGIEVTLVVVPARGLPDTAGDTAKRLAGLFAATPGVLVESWRAARHLEAVTEPGDGVLVTDHRGFGGIFALEQAAAAPDVRRIVWTLAGDGLAVEQLVVAGTIGGTDAEEAAAIDWEIVQYRCSDVVLTLGDRAGALIGRFGVDSIRLSTPRDGALGTADEPARVLQLPERVSRRSQTPRMLRAVSGLLEERPDVTVFTSTSDAPDEIWSGTTWEATEPALRPFDNRVHRTGDLLTGAALILGDVLEVPGDDVVAVRDDGRTVVVPRGSPAAALWPDAPTWDDEDDLARVLRQIVAGTPRSPAAAAAPQELPTGGRRPVLERASQVSVGVPVFRDVDYLDECVASILQQDQAPHEVVLLDDGSYSREIDAQLDRWAGERPGLIRVLRQPNRGVCVARNTMLEAMTGDAFVFIDQDDVLAPGFISRCAQALRNDPSLWAVATWTEFFGSYQAVEAKPPFDRRVGQRENPIVSTAALVDMRVRDEGVRFAPDLAFIFCEDWHVWSQIVAAGGRIGLVPEPLVKHRVHTDSGGFRRTDLARRIGAARATEPLSQGPATGRPSEM